MAERDRSHAPHHRGARRVWCRWVATVVGLAAGLRAPAVSHAELGTSRRPIAILAPGPSVELAVDGTWRFGAELSFTQYVGKWGAGAVFGVLTPGRFFVEAQPVLVLGSKTRSLLIGLNPGLVVDLTGSTPRYGGQATLWSDYAVVPIRGGRAWASPLVPFVRAQAIAGAGTTFTAGVTLKLPVVLY